MSSDFDAEEMTDEILDAPKGVVHHDDVKNAIQRAYDAGLRRGVEDAAGVCERKREVSEGVRRRTPLDSTKTWSYCNVRCVAFGEAAYDIRALLDPKPDPDQGPGDPLVSKMLREHSSGEMRPFETVLIEQDLSVCPGCGGPADNGHDRELPPNPYLCTKCDEEMRGSRGSAGNDGTSPSDSGEDAFLRPEVWAFAHLMESKLREHDHRPGWKADHPFELLGRLEEESAELRAEVYRHPRDSEQAAWEAVDVANFSMMIVDVLGGLRGSAADWAVSRGPSTSTPPQPVEIAEADAGRAPGAPRPGPCRVCGNTDCYMHMTWTDAEIDRELTIRAAYAALRPHDHDRPADRVDDVWKRPLGEDEWEEDGLHIMTVCNVGPDSLLMEDGEWWDDHMLLDEGFVRQKREGDAEGSES